MPLDGGYIALTWFEVVRSRLYACLRRPHPAPVNPTRLMPLTYGATLIFGAFILLTVTADLINPITR